MKYLLIIWAFFLSGAFARTNSPSPKEENCAYSTQGSPHPVSVSAYHRLLAQLTKDEGDKEKRTPRKKSTKGQR